MRTIAFLLPLLLAGCLERAWSEFLPSADMQSFTYSQVATPAFPDQSVKGETARLDQLQVWLDANDMCQAGYRIVERIPVVIDPNFPENKRITYRGDCS